MVSLSGRYIWDYNKDGVYLVMSGKLLQDRLSSMHKPGTKENSTLNNIKHRVWKVKTIPKTRMFLWRALSEALAVAECLNSHGVQVDWTCKIYKMSDETVNLILFECATARIVWLWSNIPAPRQGFSHSLISNMDCVLSLMGKEDVQMHVLIAIPWILCEIWKN